MKRQVIAVALGSLLALPAFANNEIDAGYRPNAMVESAKSRDQVRAELVEAQRAGQIAVNSELGLTATQTAAAAKSRDEVVAEAIQAYRSGNFIVNAELGTTANQL